MKETDQQIYNQTGREASQMEGGGGDKEREGKTKRGREKVRIEQILHFYFSQKAEKR